MTRSVTLLLSVLVLAVAGCGGDDGGSTDTQGGETTPPPAATVTGKGGTDGKQLFAGTCGSCHTLKDAGTSGTFGPNLDDLKPDKDRVLNAIETGPGAMPEKLFEGEQAEAVAVYVSGAAGK